MRNLRVKGVLLFLLLAGVVLPQTSSIQYVTPEIRRVGDKLACKCGSCNNTVGTCNMLQCHYSEPAREKIAGMQTAGKSDQAIVDSFVQEQGLSALASPPATGFHLLGWIMPFIALGLGLLLVVVWIKRFRRPPVAVVEVPGRAAANDRYRERIEREMADLE